LYDSGVIIAICSKNDENLALEVFEKHPYMLLKKEHLAAWRINWINKAENIKSIVDELNIGMD